MLWPAVCKEHKFEICIWGTKIKGRNKKRKLCPKISSKPHNSFDILLASAMFDHCRTAINMLKRSTKTGTDGGITFEKPIT
jgi:hypothetical protein